MQLGLLRGVAEVAFHGGSVAFVLRLLCFVSAAVASGFVVASVGVVGDTIVGPVELFARGSRHASSLPWLDRLNDNRPLASR